MTPTNTYTIIEGGITAPGGYRAAGVHCGIRRAKKDIALLVSDAPAAVAGVFTTNKAAAAPILVTKAQLRKQHDICRAVVINSGNANACTGERGLNDAWATVHAVAAALDLPGDQVLVSSTGVIGQYLAMEKILAGVESAAAALSVGAHRDAAEAIMTTDTYSKELAATFDLDGTTITVGVMAKGSGMIAPNMATMLGFVTTDLAIPQPLLAAALRDANARSFNRISVDGDTSTNDMVLAMANGAAGNDPVAAGSEGYEKFRVVLEHLLIVMAKMIARDGEGATKLIEVTVKGAATEGEAALAARSVATSNLVKTAIHGNDANWGRIIAAVGYSGIEFDPEAVAIALGGVPVLESGYRIVIDEEKARAALSGENVVITIDLGQGSHEATFWTCDLTKEYVHINASYRS